MKKKPILTMRRRREEAARPIASRLAWIFVGCLAALVLVLIVQSVRRHDALIAWRGSLEEGGTLAVWPAWRSMWPALPKPPARATAIVSDLSGPYAFAALNSETLRFIPCYCGCRRDGHQSVQNCFVKGFTTSGTPIWTDHAFTCQTCVNIVRETARMLQRGMALPAIRTAIDEHHGGLFSKSTATPLPK